MDSGNSALSCSVLRSICVQFGNSNQNWATPERIGVKRQTILFPRLYMSNKDGISYFRFQHKMLCAMRAMLLSLRMFFRPVTLNRRSCLHGSQTHYRLMNILLISTPYSTVVHTRYIVSLYEVLTMSTHLRLGQSSPQESSHDAICIFFFLQSAYRFTWHWPLHNTPHGKTGHLWATCLAARPWVSLAWVACLALVHVGQASITDRRTHQYGCCIPEVDVTQTTGSDAGSRSIALWYRIDRCC